MKAFIHQISLQGKRDTNQDRISIETSKSEIRVGIYDGHGDQGDFVSSYLKKHFISGMRNLNDKEIVQNYLYEIQNNLQKHNKTKESGSTLLVMKIDLKNKKTLTINLGDCRALIGYNGKSMQLTHDHKVDDENERIRLLARNANIEYDKEDEMFRVDGYAISRSMGNRLYNSISQKADIYAHEFSRNTNYIVLGCDGLWDSLSNKDVNDFILTKQKGSEKSNQQKAGGKNIAYLLAKEAIKRGSQDNVSIAIVFFA
jgi:protein phosphatase 2C family protein 2/3